jgi:threonine dehydrogenase-like Zn-dependent dehydrogenase
MRATVMYGAFDVPDAQLIEPTDALVSVTRAAICGSDLWPYKSMEPSETGRRMGHEFVGVVEGVGSEVRSVKQGDFVISPFLWSDGTCASGNGPRSAVSSAPTRSSRSAARRRSSACTS